MLLDLVFDDLALFLDHQDLVQALGEFADALGLQRPGHAYLQQPQSHGAGGRLVDAHHGQGLAHVQVALAGGHDAQPGARDVPVLAVQAVLAHVFQQRVQALALQAILLLQRRIRPADVETAFRNGIGIGYADVHRHGIDLHGGGRLHGVADDLQSHPAARIARHRIAVQAELDQLAHAGRVQDRDHGRDERVFALVGQGGRFAGVVVAGHQHDAAMPRTAGDVAVLEHVAAAVHAGALAVPQRVHAVGGGPGVQADHLRAPDRGGRQFLVESRHELDAVGFQVAGGLPHLQVHRPERRAPVARDEARGVQPGRFIALLLRQHQAHQRLRSGHVDAAARPCVLVVQGQDGLDGLCAHDALAVQGWARKGVARIQPAARGGRWCPHGALKARSDGRAA